MSLALKINIPASLPFSAETSQQTVPTTPRAAPKKSVLDSILAIFGQLSTAPKFYKVPQVRPLSVSMPSSAASPMPLPPTPMAASPTASISSSSNSSGSSTRSVSPSLLLHPESGSAVSAPVAIVARARLSGVNPFVAPQPRAPSIVPARAPTVMPPPLALPVVVIQAQPLIQIIQRDPYAEYETVELDKAQVTKILTQLFNNEGQGSLDFSKLPQWVRGALLEAGETISSLDLSTLATTKQDMEALATYFPELTNLTICAKKLTDVDCASIAQFGLLVQLKIAQGNKLTALVFGKLKLPRLQTLEIDAPNGALVTDRYPTEAAQQAMQAFLYSHENLRAVRVGEYTTALQRVDDTAFQELLTNEHNRCDIDFEFAAQQLSDQTLHFISTTLTKLERIAFVGCRNFTDAGLAALTALPELTEVEFYGAEQISAAAIVNFKAHFVNANTGNSRLKKCIVTKALVPEIEIE